MVDQATRPMRSAAIIPLMTIALSGTADAQSTPPATAAPKFIMIDEDALLGSRLIGLSIQNTEGEDVGRIEDVVLEGGRLVGIILSVGDIKGSGQRYIAVDPSSISINFTEGENTWRATMNSRIDQLKVAPEFRYEGKWKR